MDHPTPIDLLLITINARYIHASLALRCLRANLGSYRSRSRLVEFDLKTPSEILIDTVVQSAPKMLVVSLYIWNAQPFAALLPHLRSLLPNTIFVIGGPEISYQSEDHPCFRWADVVLCGEGEEALRSLCDDVLQGRFIRAAAPQVIQADPPDLSAIKLPYDEYTDHDIQHRTLYVETARGCPFQCSYCLSAMDNTVRYFPAESLFAAFETLMERGARAFRILDRSFNLDIPRALDVLDFFLKAMQRFPLSLHLEMIPDRFPDVLMDKLACFPAEALHLEVGIQTYTPDVAQRIHRVCDFDEADRCIAKLVDMGIAVHVDLIAGLPGETWTSFAASFDRLAALQPHEIQVGILKQLRGAPIARLAGPFALICSNDPPYEVLSTSTLTADELERIGRLARFWENIHNREKLPRTTRYIAGLSPFEQLSVFSDYLFARFQRTHHIPLLALIEAAFHFLTEEHETAPAIAAKLLLDDYLCGGKRICPPRYLLEQASS